MKDQQKPPLSWALIGVFIIVSAVVIFLGLQFIIGQKEHLINDKKDELKTITDLKVGQIAQWRHERIGDAILIRDNMSLADQISNFLYRTDNLKEKMALLRWMNSIIDNYDYYSAAIADSIGRVKLSVPGKDSLIGSFLSRIIPASLADQKIILTDLYRVSQKSLVHIDIVIPLVRKQESVNTTIGLIVLRIDPQDILYPLIKSWPTQSKTSETLLLKQEGDSVVYLNELRHLPNSALSFKRSVDEKELIGAMAVKGFEGIIEGIDYRNVPVVAAIKKVPESSWYLVSKVDKDEIDSLFSEQRNLARLLIIFFVSAFGAIIGWTIWHQRVRFYRQRYEAELERLALRKHFDYILKYANDIILLIDGDLQIVEVNDHALEIYQYNRKELIGMSIMGLRIPELASQLTEIIGILKDIGSTTYETVHRRKDGTTFPVEISARLFEIEGVKYYQSIGRDITERKLAERSIIESEERFRKIFEESPFGIAMSRIDYKFFKINTAFCKMMGYKEDEILSMTFRNFTHPEYIHKDEESLQLLIDGKIPFYRTEKRYIRKDNSIIWGSTTVNTIDDREGHVQYMLVMVEDITSRKNSEFELEKSLSLLKATIESTDDGLLVVDTAGRIVMYNQRFAEIWKIPQEVLDKKDDNLALSFVLNQLKDPDYFLSYVKYLYSSTEKITTDILEFKDGRIFERYSQPQTINGLTVGRVWSFRDITQKKIAENQLIGAKEKAEESDTLKTAFLHNISHEIRTPMNAIVGFTGLLEDPDLDIESRKQFIKIISQSTNQLLSIISDIVDISNIETNQVKLTFSEVNINSIIKSLYEQFSLTANQQKLLFRYEVRLPDEKAFISTDNTKMIQILSNLLNNAFKFTKQGTIQFGYKISGENLEFFVKDTGIGISEEEQPRIFDRFYQVENQSSRQYPGAGLGLSICKAYVELLGGSIIMKSNIGKGSEFCITLPITKAGLDKA
jgi:PAS domain S-box-containing protein